MMQDRSLLKRKRENETLPEANGLLSSSQEQDPGAAKPEVADFCEDAHHVKRLKTDTTSEDVIMGAYLLTKLNDKKQQTCANCNTTNTPLWRKGWYDKNENKSVMLCNACGLKYAKNQYCPYCKYIYKMNQDVNAKRKEWLNCSTCKRWVHAKCEITYGAKHPIIEKQQFVFTSLNSSKDQSNQQSPQPSQQLAPSIQKHILPQLQQSSIFPQSSSINRPLIPQSSSLHQSNNLHHINSSPPLPIPINQPPSISHHMLNQQMVVHNNNYSAPQQHINLWDNVNSQRVLPPLSPIHPLPSTVPYFHGFSAHPHQDTQFSMNNNNNNNQRGSSSSSNTIPPFWNMPFQQYFSYVPGVTNRMAIPPPKRPSSYLCPDCQKDRGSNLTRVEFHFN